MYDFWYNYVKPNYGKKSKFYCIDTGVKSRLYL